MITAGAYTARTQNWMALAPDLTPMIDVMFILMIFFILTANAATKTMDVTLPTSAEKTISAGQMQKQMIITLKKDGSYAIDEAEYATLEALKTALETVDSSKELLVASDKSAEVQAFVELLSALRAAEFTIANIIMEQP